MKQKDLVMWICDYSEVYLNKECPENLECRNYLITITQKNDPSHCLGFPLTVVFEE